MFLLHMSLNIAALAIDFGLVILVWMVQLVIYPSFLFYTRANLVQWHTPYTAKITVIVGPLMLAQLLLALLHLYSHIGVASLIYCILVVGTWLLTFLVFIPLHGEIQENKFSENSLKKLIHLNWYRTALWSIIFILSLVRYLL